MQKIYDSFKVFFGFVFLGGIVYYFVGENGFKVTLVLGVAAAILNLFTSDNNAPKEIKDNKNQDLVRMSEQPSNNKAEYATFVPDLLSLCVAAGGKKDQNVFNLAVAFLENDDLINNKKLAVESFTENFNLLYRSGDSYLAVFKLRSTALIRMAHTISDDFHKERLNIILDGIIDLYKENQDDVSAQKILYVKENINSNSTKSLKK